MQVPQKAQYALRGIFELAKRYGQGPVKVAEIAKAQAIPPRFLEVILGQLKHGGFVESRRGSEGGYLLVRRPDSLNVGDVMRFLEGDMSPVDCLASGSDKRCRLYGGCVFLPMWKKVEKAISDVFDGTSFQDLLMEEKKSGQFVPGYSI